MSENQIKGYFAFDDSDLIANRAGRLSPKQEKKIISNDQFANRVILGFFLVCLAFTLFFAYKVFSDSTSIPSWVGLILAMFFGSLFSRGLFTKVDYSVQKVEGEVQFVKVEKLSGSATDPMHKRQKVSSYEMHIGGESFSNANPALIEIMQGDVYAVYYTKTTRQILSVEFIAKGK
ncbi:MAG: hypothetical protein JNJ43_02685 [Anaerolineales bacterium]|nr:hypothetical protein [Anaerolineales bacterium]